MTNSTTNAASNHKRSSFRAFLLQVLYALGIMFAGGVFAFLLKRFL